MKHEVQPWNIRFTFLSLFLIQETHATQTHANRTHDPPPGTSNQPINEMASRRLSTSRNWGHGSTQKRAWTPKVGVVAGWVLDVCVDIWFHETESHAFHSG